MYEKCATCTKIGISCRGPKFVSMQPNELLTLCKARKAYLGLTNQQIADRANMSKGTVDGLFAAVHTDFRYGTIQPVLDVLFGGDVSGNPCPEPEADERARYEEQIAQYERTMQEAEKKIAFLKDQVRFKEDQMHEKDTLLKERGAFMKRKDKYIVFLTIALVLCLLLIITALVIDRTNSGIGFFWLESLFKPNSIIEVFNNWRT